MRHAILAAIVGVAAASAQTPQPPDTILVNGHVITVDQAFSIVQAIAIRDGRFTAVGSDAVVRKLASRYRSIFQVDAYGHNRHPLDTDIIPQLENLFFMQQ